MSYKISEIMQVTKLNEAAVRKLLVDIGATVGENTISDWIKYKRLIDKGFSVPENVKINEFITVVRKLGEGLKIDTTQTMTNPAPGQPVVTYASMELITMVKLSAAEVQRLSEIIDQEGGTND